MVTILKRHSIYKIFRKNLIPCFVKEMLHLQHLKNLSTPWMMYNSSMMKVFMRCSNFSTKESLKIADMSKCIFYISDDKNCPVCLKNFEQDDIVNTLPCNHRFHSDCIKKWLEKVFETKQFFIQFNKRSRFIQLSSIYNHYFQTNSCPVCRREYPTDDKHYEEMIRHKKRQKEREQDIENLHNSMFG